MCEYGELVVWSWGATYVLAGCCRGVVIDFCPTYSLRVRDTHVNFHPAKLSHRITAATLMILAGISAKRPTLEKRALFEITRKCYQTASGCKHIKTMLNTRTPSQTHTVEHMF